MGELIQGNFETRAGNIISKRNETSETDDLLRKRFQVWLKNSSKWREVQAFRSVYGESEIQEKSDQIKAYTHSLGTNAGLMRELDLRPGTQVNALWLLAAVEVLKERFGIKN